MLSLFSLLTTVKNIAITQNAVYHNLKPGTTKSKEGALMYQNPLSNPFFVLWVVQSGPSSRTIGKELTRLHKSSYPGESFFESCTIAAWFGFINLWLSISLVIYSYKSLQLQKTYLCFVSKRGVKGLSHDTWLSVFNFRERWKYGFKTSELWLVSLSSYVNLNIFYPIFVIFN